MRQILLVLIGLCVTQAQLPDAPEPKLVDKTFLLTTAALAGGEIADYGLTARAVGRGCVESNPLLGRHPSSGHLAAYGGGEFVIVTGGNLLLRWASRRSQYNGKLWALPSWTLTAVHFGHFAHGLTVKC